MRVFDKAAKRPVQTTIDQNRDLLKAIPGFVDAEPGFAIVDGQIVREPAIIVFVTHKKPPDSLLTENLVPRQLGDYRVAVMQASPLRQLEASKAADDAENPLLTALSVSANSLTYEPPEGDPIDNEFVVDKPFLCHVGPDAGWPVLKPFLQAAERTLSVAMYDFNADYIAKSFIACIRDNDLHVDMTWDNGMTDAETLIRGQLRKLEPALVGGIVQCGSGRQFASAYHEKVAVRDSSAFWLSSGNWSLRSQPNIDPLNKPAEAKGMYSKGNREWHVIVENEDLAKVFESYIQFDLKATQAEAEAGDAGAVLSVTEDLSMPDLFVPIAALQDAALLAASIADPTAPESLPSSPRDVKVRPLLTPDNYVGHITELLKKVKRSVYLQFAYINYTDKADDAKFTELLTVLGDLSWKPGIDVRIIMGNNGAADKIRLLAQAGFNDKVFRTQSNIHNKGIIFDGKTVLVSSANWSGDGVLRNRDAGLLIADEEIAGYYGRVFADDWEQRAKGSIDDDPPVRAALADEPTPAGMVRMSWRDYYA